MNDDSPRVNQFIYYSVLYAASAALLKLLGFVFFLWLARTMSVQEYAFWGLLYSLQTGIASFGAVGIAESVVGLLRPNRNPEEQNRLFSAANRSFLVTSGLSGLFGVGLCVLFLRHTGISPATAAWVILSGGLL